MTEITIPKNITPGKIAILYDQYITESDLEPISVTIPDALNKYTFGLFSDFLRFIITLNSIRTIQVLKINIEVSQIDSLYDQEYAYPIISLLWNRSLFLDKNEHPIKDVLREKQNDFFIRMNSLKRIKGNKYTLTSTDHLSKDKGLIRLFETQYGFNDNENQIYEALDDLLKNYVLKFNKSNAFEFEAISRDIGAIVYELAKNTYEWGRTDANLVELQSSIRGIYFRFHVNQIDKIFDEYNGTPLETFFNHKSIQETCISELNKIHYLEILVFDSGVGFIDKFNPKNNLSDLDIIKKCLIKNQTSSTSSLKSKKGIGLDRILQILDNKGFIRISTDKYTVYRDLIKDVYAPVDPENLSDQKLEYWDYRKKDGPKSAGSFISILYPFKQNY